MTMFIAPKKIPTAKKSIKQQAQAEGQKKNISGNAPKTNSPKEYAGPKVEGEE